MCELNLSRPLNRPSNRSFEPWRTALGAWVAGLAAAVLALLAGPAGAALALSPGQAIAQSGVPASAVPACAVCHGAQGEGAAGPRLAGLSAAYIGASLAAFRSGARANPLMQPIARGLSPQQAAAVADYYSAAVAPSHPAPAAPAVAKAGQILAERGRWSAGLPACADCHAPGGIGVSPSFPYLAGQQAAYLAGRLASWRSGATADDPLGLMRAIAAKLRDDDVSAVAAYYASLPAPPRQGESP